jgi:hypothetical protein
MGALQHRKPRIAWSVGWGIACVLAVGYWVRSYYWNDVYAIHVGEYRFAIQSVVGRISFVRGLNTVSFHQRITNRRRLGVLVHANDNAIGFYSVRPHPSSTDFRVSAPHWWLAVLTFMLAALHWLRWRFSLRTLLVGMTVIAAILGLAI